MGQTKCQKLNFDPLFYFAKGEALLHVTLNTAPRVYLKTFFTHVRRKI